MAVVLVAAALSAHAAEPCISFHGRAHWYGGDGQARIWRIGTHHEFTPDETTWEQVTAWIEAGVQPADKLRWAAPASRIDLFADFVVCPTEPIRAGSVQTAKILSATHRRYVSTSVK